MKRHASLCVIVLFLISIAIVPGTPVPIAPAHAQTSATWTQMVQIEVPPATVRTIDNMLADQALTILAPAPGGSSAIAIPFRPGVDPAAYAAAKAATTASAQTQNPPAPAAPGPAPAAPPLGSVNCDGRDEFTAKDVSGRVYYPPDDDGAIGYSPSAGINGTKEVVEVTNAHVTVYDANAATTNCSGRQLFDTDLNSFFGYFNAGLFDPRVVHDDVYGRWIVTAIAFQEASGAQYQFIAASATDDALGPWHIYAINTKIFANVCATCFWDFDQVGYGAQAISIIANLFGGSSGMHAVGIFLNKQPLYDGVGLTGCYAESEFFNWAPPKVLDHNPETWLVSANPDFSIPQLQLAGWTSTGAACPTLQHFVTVTIPAWSLPPNAPQPGSTFLIDTSDGRFQNRSTQYGEPGLGQKTVLWNVHTIGVGAFPKPRMYRIVVCPDPLSGCTAPPTATSGDVSASGTSFDWNPSIAVDASGTVFVTWSSDDPLFGVNAQVRIGSCSGTLSACSPGSGAVVFQSSGPLYGNPDGGNVQRWGDYSSTVIDPTTPGSAFGFNEEIDNPDRITVGDSWGTRFFSFIGP